MLGKKKPSTKRILWESIEKPMETKIIITIQRATFLYVMEGRYNGLSNTYCLTSSCSSVLGNLLFICFFVMCFSFHEVLL